MTTMHNIALLVVIAAPVAVIVAMNAWAWLQGERDTLMLPGLTRFPSIAIEPREEPFAPAPSQAAEAPSLAVDPCERLAA